MKFIFEFHFSSDGIENQRAFLEGTWNDAVSYRNELSSRGYVNITIEQKENA